MYVHIAQRDTLARGATPCGPPRLASSRRPSLVTLCLVALPGYLAPIPSLMVCMPFAIVSSSQRKRHLWVLESFDFVADLGLRSSLLLALPAPPHAGTLFALRLFGYLLFVLGRFAECAVWEVMFCIRACHATPHHFRVHMYIYSYMNIYIYIYIYIYICVYRNIYVDI